MGMAEIRTNWWLSARWTLLHTTNVLSPSYEAHGCPSWQGTDAKSENLLFLRNSSASLNPETTSTS